MDTSKIENIISTLDYHMENMYQPQEISQFDDIAEMCISSTPSAMANIKEILNGIYAYGFERPSPIQSKSIKTMFDKKDMIVQSHSGTGKTGAFVIGMLTLINKSIQHPQGLIIVNTKELAIQVNHVVKNISSYMKLSSSLCVGGLVNSFENLREAQRSHILIGTPGRILDLMKKDQSLFNKLKILIMDEADILLGSNFIEQIKNIFGLIPMDVQTCIFSATYNADVMEMTKNFMENPVKIMIEPEKVNLASIKHFKFMISGEGHCMWESEEKGKFEILSDIYHSINIGQVVIFVNTIRRATTLKDQLSRCGHAVETIHAGLTNDERANIMMSFRKTQVRVLVATDLLSRGIDVQQIGLVINYDFPKVAEQYIHRVGRSGRYGRLGVAINFVTGIDIEKVAEVEKTYKIDMEVLPQLDDINTYLEG